MKQITEDEQKRIFSKNLSYFLSIKQTSMPQVSTIQKIADYFKIGKSDLVDEKLEDDPILDVRIVSDKKL